MPDAGSFAKLEALVSTLAKHLGTAAFAPHVTLIHGLALEESELAARAATLSKRLRVPPVELGPLEAGDEFFPSTCAPSRRIGSGSSTPGRRRRTASPPTPRTCPT
jgi:hypothetical protein